MQFLSENRLNKYQIFGSFFSKNRIRNEFSYPHIPTGCGPRKYCSHSHTMPILSLSPLARLPTDNITGMAHEIFRWTPFLLQPSQLAQAYKQSIMAVYIVGLVISQWQPYNTLQNMVAEKKQCVTHNTENHGQTY